MTRIIFILILVVLILMILRNIIKKIRIGSAYTSRSISKEKISNEKKQDGDNIVDAKFEEIK